MTMEGTPVKTSAVKRMIVALLRSANSEIYTPPKIFNALEKFWWVRLIFLYRNQCFNISLATHSSFLFLPLALK
jgi:hypothetical protein